MGFVHVNFSDIHFGTQDPSVYYTEELVPILEKLYDLEKIDLITSCGELFDKRVYVDDDIYIYVNKFINELKYLAALHKCAIILIEGTRSHEGDQYNIFKDNMDLVVVGGTIQYYTVKNYVIRCIPDLTWNSYDEFKKEAFSRDADITIMHGLIEGAIPIIDKHDHNTKKSVVIKVDDLEKHTMLYTVAGHIHERLQLGEHTWYTGATSASSYKDANNISFGIDIVETSKNGKYDVKFIKNKNTRVFKTININKIIEGMSLDSIKANLMLIKKNMDSREYIRLDINDVRLTPEDRINIRAVKSIFGDTFKFNIIVSTDSILSDEAKAEIERNSLNVLSRELTLSEKILLDVVDNEQVDFSVRSKLTLERIDDILNLELDELMEI